MRLRITSAVLMIVVLVKQLQLKAQTTTPRTTDVFASAQTEQLPFGIESLLSLCELLFTYGQSDEASKLLESAGGLISQLKLPELRGSLTVELIRRQLKIDPAMAENAARAMTPREQTDLETDFKAQGFDQLLAYWMHKDKSHALDLAVEGLSGGAIQMRQPSRLMVNADDIAPTLLSAALQGFPKRKPTARDVLALLRLGQSIEQLSPAFARQVLGTVTMAISSADFDSNSQEIINAEDKVSHRQIAGGAKSVILVELSSFAATHALDHEYKKLMNGADTIALKPEQIRLSYVRKDALNHSPKKSTDYQDVTTWPISEALAYAEGLPSDARASVLLILASRADIAENTRRSYLATIADIVPKLDATYSTIFLVSALLKRSEHISSSNTIQQFANLNGQVLDSFCSCVDSPTCAGSFPACVEFYNKLSEDLASRHPFFTVQSPSVTSRLMIANLRRRAKTNDKHDRSN